MSLSAELTFAPKRGRNIPFFFEAGEAGIERWFFQNITTARFFGDVFDDFQPVF